VEPVKINHLKPALWQNLFVGMSMDEVRSARPDTSWFELPQTLANGAKAFLVIPRFDLSGHLYTVKLFFLDNALVQVTLSAEGNSTTIAAYDLLTVLRAKYGPELSLSEPGIDDLLPMLKAEWLVGNGVNVCLVCFQGVCLNIVYQVRMADEMTKL